jgi:Xaa-Pro aminopeptidase
MESHAVAQRAIDPILKEAWLEIGRRLRPASGSSKMLTEFDMVQWLAEAMRREGLVWEHGPNVSVGPNSADSHYEPTADKSLPIQPGDFLLIDIWGRTEKPASDQISIHYDITWTGVIGREPTELEQRVFIAVRAARDAAIAVVEDAFAANRVIHGFEPDDAAREVIRTAGFGEFFTHRTGHNIAAELHGSGAHLDNLETHDERKIIANTCFSVEPGIYLPRDYASGSYTQFGIRSEVNMLTELGKAWVTGPRQTELVRI